ncbi:MAG: DUF2357 domain-containing protein [Cytophagales bacterium]|nr:DUF2357 domain-containing protein [Armatimonadota bacterium]
MLLAEIARVALAIGQDLYPQNTLGDLDIRSADPPPRDACPRERLAFLSAIWPRFSRALHVIEAAPGTVLHSSTQDVRVELGSLRRVSPSAVLAAVRNGDFVPAPASLSPLARRLGGRLPRRIAQSVAVASFDTPVNRAVKGILAQAARDLGGILSLAQDAAVPHIARQAEILRARLRQHLRRSPWVTLTPAPVQNTYPPVPGPAYRYVFEQWRRYRAAFAFNWANPLFSLPARETWLLYEYACWFAVADALRHLGFRTVSASDFTVSRSGLTFALARGRTSRLLFQKKGAPPVALLYNPLYPRQGTEEAIGWHSRSHALRPDIAVECEGRLLLLDAKFKTYCEPAEPKSATGKTGPVWRFTDSALLPDIQQMHTYRDAIACGSRSRLVSGAWLLYAGRRGVLNPSVVAYPQVSTADPFGAGEVGALLLRPGQTPESLQALLSGFLSS